MLLLPVGQYVKAQDNAGAASQKIRFKADGKEPAKKSKLPLFGPRQYRSTNSGVKRAPLSKVLPNGSHRKLQFTTADGVEFFGNVIFANSWQNLTEEDEDPYYVGTFTGKSPLKINVLNSDTHLDCNGGGLFADGVYRFITYFDAQLFVAGSYYEYDADTWEQLRYEDVSDRPDLYAFDTALDPVTGRLYGCTYNSDYSGYQFSWLDYSDFTSHVVSKLDRLFVALAINSKGNVYGISEAGDLCKINKSTGKITVVGNTGLRPAYVQSATFDKRTDNLYWAASFSTDNSALYQVDTLTAKVNKIANFPDNEEISCLTVVEKLADGNAPGKAQDLKVSFPKGSLTGEVSFIAPTVTFGGEPLSGEMTYEVKANNAVASTGTCLPGDTVTVPATVKKGEAFASVTLSNSYGRSPIARLYFWAGPDNPKAVSSLKLKIDSASMKSILSWRAPTQGLHDGYVSAPNVTYTITREPGSKVVARNYTKTKFEETLPKQKLTSYCYSVTPFYEGLQGQTAKSNRVLVGDAFDVPYYENFDNAEDFNLFTVVDNNNDGASWGYSSNYSCAYCTFNSAQSNDDWLITPELHLNAGRQYKFSFVARRGMQDYPQKIAAGFGRELDPSAYSEIIPVTELASTAFQRFQGAVNVKEEGNYHFGVHNVSMLDCYRTYLDSIAVTEGPKLSAPDSVASFTIKPDPDGYGSAVLHFVAPRTDVIGNKLDNKLSRIDIYRHAETDELVKSLSNVSPGQEFTITDDEALNGFNTYTVTAYSGEDAGQPAVKSVYVGIDTPTEPVNIKAVASANDATITWEAPGKVGFNGGYVDTTSLTYNAYKLDLSSASFVPEKQGIESKIYHPEISMTGEQDLHFYGITAVSEVGESDYGLSNLIISGAPYKLPFIETFAKGRLDNSLWWVDTEEEFSTSMPYYSADENMGSATWTPTATGQEASFNSGKILIKGAKNPLLHFSHYGTPGSDYRLLLNVMTPDNELHNVKTVDFRNITGERRWIEEEVDLKPFANEDFIVLKFLAQCFDTKFYLTGIDKIELMDVKGHNLMAKSITPDLTGTVAKPLSAQVKVRNIGSNEETGFNVNLICNDKVVATVDGGRLASFADSTYTLTFVPKIEQQGQILLRGEVSLSTDEDDTDNQTSTSKVTVKAPELPVVTTLTASAKNNGTQLDWQKPASDAKSITEDFESFTPWSIYSNQNGWTLVDGDKLKTIGITGLSWANMGAPQAYITFDPYDLGVSAVTRYQPHSGKQYMASFAAYDDDDENTAQNDDWLISPELDGNAQTISVWAKAASASYTPESCEILYSTNSTAISDFKKIDSYDLAADKWYELITDLPEGTKYFAVRCTSKDKFAFFVDDITYHKGHVTLQKYNIYRDGKKIASTAAGETAYLDDNTSASSVYTVTVVYEEGESAMSNEASLATGITEVGEELFRAVGIDGSIEITNPEQSDVEVFAFNGGLIAKRLGKHYMKITVPRGVYLVKAKDNVVKVVVR